MRAKQHIPSKIALAIPMLDEWENLSALLYRISRQTLPSFSVYVCVNQPDAWWSDGSSDHLAVCQHNQLTLQALGTLDSSDHFSLSLIDRSSQGLGWKGKKKGVGWARKELFARILEENDEGCVIVSMDADTDFDADYLERVRDAFSHNPTLSALSVPYYHPLTGIEQMDRPLLRYECYMRHYLIQLLKINNDYAFSALGSAMAFPVWAYRKAGGMNPLQGGEDFYLMQRFVKTGSISLDFNSVVRPSGRPSHRVPFGTGPAVAMSLSIQESHYPFYPPVGFAAVKATFDLFPDLYFADKETPMSDFLRKQLATEDLWGPLRKNFKSQDLFVHACKERVDGLRILQFLKTFPLDFHIPVSFAFSPLDELMQFRDSLFHEEMSLRLRKN